MLACALPQAPACARPAPRPLSRLDLLQPQALRACSLNSCTLANRHKGVNRDLLLRCRGASEGPTENDLDAATTNGTGGAVSEPDGSSWAAASSGAQTPFHATAAWTPPPQAALRQPGGRQAQIQALKARLLASVASLDRGLAAKAQEARDVDTLASQLELLGGTVSLRPRPQYLEDSATEGGAGAREGGGLGGMWRLVYTSGFNSGSLGGRRPGPPAALVPTTLGQVYQRIDPTTGRLDNIVELLFTAGLPDLPALLFGQPSSGRQDSPGVRLTLQHEYEVQGANTVQIVFTETSGELVGSSWFRNLPRLELPSLPEALRPPRFLRSAKFEVSFLDAGMRVTRGDRSELRIYLREEEADPAGSGMSGRLEEEEEE